MFKYLLLNNARTIPKQLSILEVLNERYWLHSFLLNAWIPMKEHIARNRFSIDKIEIKIYLSLKIKIKINYLSIGIVN